MYKEKRFLGLIPARGGSKGIPGKNIIPVAGMPLIEYSISAALGSQYLDAVVVSTDAEDIAEIALKAGARVPFLRPAALAGDQAKTIYAVLHAVDALREKGEQYDAVVLLQPTQPLRTAEHIDEAIRLFMEESCEPLVGVCSVVEHPVLMRTILGNKRLCSVLNLGGTKRRQDFQDVYKVNGVIYINAIDVHLNESTSLNDNVVPYIMSREVSVDVDDYQDLERVEKWLYSYAD